MISIIMLLGTAAVGQTYDSAYYQSLKERQPLVVGVGCMPPPGPWISASTRTLAMSDGKPWQRHVIVISVPRDGWVEVASFLHAGATRRQIEDELQTFGLYRRQREADKDWKPIPQQLPKKYDPATQPNFQEKMNRRQRVYYTTPFIAPRVSTPAFRASQC